MYKYIDKIESPQDIKKLRDNQLEEMCSEIRECLINTVSDSGGHLASNLGVVELTVALHRVFNAPKDKIVWDVGHQSYVHKILTGRMSRLNTIRSDGGLCGFCNPKESEYDVCHTGHASSSVSTALGLAQARKINGGNYNVVAVIGDGAFTGGLAFEALNNAGIMKTKMIIILNDNEMSIGENVGSFAKFLSKARTNPKYTASKRKIANALLSKDGGREAYDFIRRLKTRIKGLVAPNLFFEQLGITYLGPVDGHSIKDMESLFLRATELDEPVMIHVVTKKGCGYTPAEQFPHKYHGVSPFEKETGIVDSEEESYSTVFGKCLCDIAQKNKHVAAITPAMLHGSGLYEFSKQFPQRFYDVGIAEGHAVTFASGLARAGIVPVVAIYSTFLQRGYDNVLHDVCIDNEHVVFAIDRAGLVANDGVTHQGLFDISYLTSIPNMTVLAPSCYDELRKMLDYAVNVHKGPIALRYPRQKEELKIDYADFELSKATVLKEGEDVTILAMGSLVKDALKAGEILNSKGISAEIIDARTIKPIDFDTIFKSAEKTGALICIEEGMRRGGMGEMVASRAKERALDFKLKIKAIDEEFVPHASIQVLKERYGFLPEQIAKDAERVLNS